MPSETIQPVRWAIMGTGLIARKVTPLLHDAANCLPVLSASRDASRAQSFAGQFDLSEGGCTYDELLERSDIDAVYLTLPNHLHVPWSIKLLEAGKHVLCEKPLSPSAQDAQRVFDVAAQHGRHCVEGFMYMHHPQTARLIEIARAGNSPGSVIGQLRSIDAGSCLDLLDRPNIESRLSHAMHGGAIMDLGCYPIGLARLLTGEEPIEFDGSAELDIPQPGEEYGVDVFAEMDLEFPSGVVAHTSCAIDRDEGVWTELVGDWGRAWTELPFRPDPDEAVICVERFGAHPDGPGEDEIVIPHGGDRFSNQFADFADLVRGVPGARPVPSPEWSIGQAACLEQALDFVGVAFAHA